MWFCMLDLLLMWLSGTLQGAPSQILCLLLAHWSWDDDLWWSVSVAKVLWLRKSRHKKAGTCWMPWLHILWHIVCVIHMQLCFLGAPQPKPELSQGPSSEYASLIVSQMSVLTEVVSASSCLGGLTSAAALDTSCNMMPPAVLLMGLPCTPDSNQLKLSHSYIHWNTLSACHNCAYGLTMPKAKYIVVMDLQKWRTVIENHCIINDWHVTDPGNFTFIKKKTLMVNSVIYWLSNKVHHPGSVEKQEEVCLQI